MASTLTLPASPAREKEKYTLPEAAIRKIEEKIDQGCRFGFAEITLVIEKGRFSFWLKLWN